MFKLNPIYYLQGFEVTKTILEHGETEYRIIYPDQKGISGELVLMIPPPQLVKGRSIVTRLEFGEKDHTPPNWEEISRMLMDKAAEITFRQESLPNMITYFDDEDPKAFEMFRKLGFTCVDHEDKFLLRNVFLEEIRGKQEYDEKVFRVLFFLLMLMFLGLLVLQWMLIGEIRL